MSTDQPRSVDNLQALDAVPAAVPAAEQEQRQTATEFSRASQNQASMEVKVYSPFRDYFDGRAFSVSAVNATGPFDILPQHHNFISLLSACDLVVRTVKEGDDRRISISGGIMHVKANKVIVFLDV